MNPGCTKKMNSRECQLLCQQTSGCVRFIYVENTYNGIHGPGARMNCCLRNDLSGEAVFLQDVVAGPVYCPKGDFLFWLRVYSTWSTVIALV